MVRCFMVSLRHSIMAEGACSRSGARRRLSRPLQFEHLRVEHQVNGFLGCDYNISIGQRIGYTLGTVAVVHIVGGPLGIKRFHARSVRWAWEGVSPFFFAFFRAILRRALT